MGLNSFSNSQLSLASLPDSRKVLVGDSRGFSLNLFLPPILYVILGKKILLTYGRKLSLWEGFPPLAPLIPGCV